MMAYARYQQLVNTMIVDCHVHICAHDACARLDVAEAAEQPPVSLHALAARDEGNDERTERDLEATLARTIDETPRLDAAVVLAFDAVHDRDGRIDVANTHLYVKNDYVMELAGRHPKMLFGASIHPYRKDAVAELERCVGGGAVLLKWLPITQNFNPADPRCMPFYEALAHYKLPLLCHTGGREVIAAAGSIDGRPEAAQPALDRGVRVIMAHCGTRSLPWEQDLRRHVHAAGPGLRALLRRHVRIVPSHAVARLRPGPSEQDRPGKACARQ